MSKKSRLLVLWCLPALFAAPAFSQIDFNNVTLSVVDQTEISDYRFDAMWGDFNNDGCLEPFIWSHSDGSTGTMYTNDCAGNFTLQPNSQVGFFQPDPDGGSGWVAVIDYDQDGDDDLLLRDSGDGAKYRNAGASSALFDLKTLECDSKIGCNPGDIDGDGNLDVVLSDRSVKRFSDGEIVYPPGGQGLGARLVVDINGDGWPDMMDPQNGGWWRNESGTLVWVSRDWDISQTVLDNLIDRTEGLNHQVAADFDNDGDFDYLIYPASVKYQDGVRLYVNNGDDTFTEQSGGIPAVTFRTYFTSYGNLLAADMDNDSRMDIVIGGASRNNSVTILKNLGNLQFIEVDYDFGSSNGSNPYQSGKGRVDVADYDEDGLIDIVKTQEDTNVGIFRNTTQTQNGWLSVKVMHPNGDARQIHAKVEVLQPSIGALITQHQTAVNGQKAARTLHLGLSLHETVDIRVTYPHGGPVYTHYGIEPNQSVIAYADGSLDAEGGTPPPPPTCLDFTYTQWSWCEEPGVQSRSVIAGIPAGCVGGDPVVTQLCQCGPVQ